jgi:arabinose-5-phosphate isomerase
VSVPKNLELKGAVFSAAPQSAEPFSVQELPILEQAKAILDLESSAITDLKARLNEGFVKAIELLYACEGKVIVTGIGKSGHIGRKLAATFASTGTPAFFVHTGELKHGDLGMVEETDVVVVISGTGETQELLGVLDSLKGRGAKLIAITGDTSSTLARVSDVALDTAVDREACPLNLAPTTSTTAALAMGDTLAIVLMTKKGFGTEDFAKSHPGGSLGRQLLRVKDVMRSGVEVPSVKLTDDYPTVLSEVDCKKLGFTTVCDDTGKLIGIITDGDLRRSILRFGNNVFSTKAEQIMTASPKTIGSENLAVEALKLMEKHTIADLLIINANKQPIGVIDLKDLLKAGLF